MPKLIAEEHKDFQLLPKDSMLFLRIVDLEVRDVERRNGGHWQKLEFTFEVTGIQQIGDGSDPSTYSEMVNSKIWGSAPFKLTDSPDNKLKRWIEAILGLEITAGFELDTDYLLKREVRGTTSVYEKRNKNPRTGLPFMGHQVEDLLAKGSANPALGGWGGQGGAQPAQQPQQAAQRPAQQTAQPAQAGMFSGWDDAPPF
jgi:hypothetical protein